MEVILQRMTSTDVLMIICGFLMAAVGWTAWICAMFTDTAYGHSVRTLGEGAHGRLYIPVLLPLASLMFTVGIAMEVVQHLTDEDIHDGRLGPSNYLAMLLAFCMITGVLFMIFRPRLPRWAYPEHRQQRRAERRAARTTPPATTPPTTSTPLVPSLSIPTISTTPTIPLPPSTAPVTSIDYSADEPSLHLTDHEADIVERFARGTDEPGDFLTGDLETAGITRLGGLTPVAARVTEGIASARKRFSVLTLTPKRITGTVAWIGPETATLVTLGKTGATMTRIAPPAVTALLPELLDLHPRSGDRRGPEFAPMAALASIMTTQVRDGAHLLKEFANTERHIILGFKTKPTPLLKSYLEETWALRSITGDDIVDGKEIMTVDERVLDSGSQLYFIDENIELSAPFRRLIPCTSAEVWARVGPALVLACDEGEDDPKRPTTT